MGRKEVYKVEVESCAINKEKKWDDVLIYNNLKYFIKSVFDNVTKLTLAGFLLEVGQYSSKLYIMIIAIFLLLLLVVNVALDLSRLVDKISSYVLERKMGNISRAVICIVTILFIYLCVDYIVFPIIGDVIGYVSNKANV